MKKLFTLCLGLVMVSALHAQSREEARRVILGGKKGEPSTGNSGGGSQNPRDVILGGGGNNNGGPNTYPSGSSRESRIEAINRDYDNKIISVRNNPTLSAEEKDRIIRQLERDRQRRIAQVNGEYKGSKKGKGNNGKHKGWYKGKGHQKKEHRGHDHDDD
jgi:hypothetical protein